MASDTKQRIAIWTHWVEVADVPPYSLFSDLEQCMEVNNFSGLMAIISAFKSEPIYRLEWTWSMITKETKQILKDLNDVTSYDRKYAAYHKKIQTINPPALPYLGIDNHIDC